MYSPFVDIASPACLYSCVYVINDYLFQLSFLLCALPYVFSDNMAGEAFKNAKRLLAATVLLQHPAPNVELSLVTDASDFHMGGRHATEIRQALASSWFFEKKVTEMESRYSTFDQELLAVYLPI